MQYLSFNKRLILLSIMSSWPVHVVASVRISFLLRLNNILLYVYHILCITSALQWILGLLQSSGCTVSNSYDHERANTCSHVFISLRYVTRGGVIGSFGASMSHCSVQLQYCSPGLCHITALSATHTVHFLHTLAYTCFSFLDNGHSNGCEVVISCGLGLHFPND